jgi:hypothetical protein
MRPIDEKPNLAIIRNHRSRTGPGFRLQGTKLAAGVVMPVQLLVRSFLRQRSGASGSIDAIAHLEWAEAALGWMSSWHRELVARWQNRRASCGPCN